MYTCIHIYTYIASLCCPHSRRSTQSQVKSASVKDAANITDSRSDTVLSVKCPVWKDQSCRDSWFDEDRSEQ